MYDMAGKNFSKYMGWHVWAPKYSTVVMAGKSLNVISGDKKFNHSTPLSLE
jgi:roadblock/LC7 domain-containing protein